MNTPQVLMILAVVALFLAAIGAKPPRFIHWGWLGLALWCLAIQWAAVTSLSVLILILIVLLILVLIVLLNRPKV